MKDEGTEGRFVTTIVHENNFSFFFYGFGLSCFITSTNSHNQDKFKSTLYKPSVQMYTYPYVGAGWEGHLNVCIGREGHLNVCIGREGHLNACVGREGHLNVCIGRVHVCIGREGHLNVCVGREGHLHVGAGWEGHLHVCVGREGHLHVGAGREGHLHACVGREGHLHVGAGRDGHLHVGAGWEGCLYACACLPDVICLCPVPTREVVGTQVFLLASFRVSIVSALILRLQFLEN